MNILFFMRYWPIYGGGETVTATLANEFVKNNIGVHVAYQFYNTIENKPYSLDGRIREVCLHTIEDFRKSDVVAVREYVRNNNIDIIINQWGNLELCHKAVQGTNCKIIHCCHTSVLLPVTKPSGIKQTLLYKVLSQKGYEKFFRWNQVRILKKNYRLCDKYIFLAKSFANEYESLTKIRDKQKKIGYISNPLTFNVFFDFDKYSSKQKETLFVGRIFEYPKRISYILKIWEMIEADPFFDDWKLTIVGDGDDLSRFIKDAKDRNLRRISFEGFKAPQTYYERSSIFLMTSSSEGFGMTLVEAQQYGVVPIAMDSYASLHDIVSDRFNGVIVKDNDIDGFVSELKNLMKDEITRKEMAKNAVRSCKKFSMNDVNKKWFELFEAL